jgi:hypothetical protein
MKYLVYCTCEHGLDRHTPEGCVGGRTPCPCPKDQAAALEAAIAEARSASWVQSGEEATASHPA